MIFPPEVDEFWRRLERIKSHSAETMGPKPIAEKLVRRVETPKVEAEGVVEAATRVAMQVAAGMVNAEESTFEVKRADITGLEKPNVKLHRDGRLESEQEVEVTLQIRIKNSARLALGVSGRFETDEIALHLEPKERKQ